MRNMRFVNTGTPKQAVLKVTNAAGEEWSLAGRMRPTDKDILGELNLAIFEKDSVNTKPINDPTASDDGTVFLPAAELVLETLAAHLGYKVTKLDEGSDAV